MQLGEGPCAACGKSLVHAKPSGSVGRIVGFDLLAFFLTLPLVAIGIWVHYIAWFAVFALLAFGMSRALTREKRWVCVSCGKDRGPAPATEV